MMRIVDRLSSRGALIVILVVICSLFILFFYAVSRNAEIHFSKKGFFRIIPKGSERIKELEEELMETVSFAEHKKLQQRSQKLKKENLILASRCSRLLAVSGVDVSEGDDKAIRKLELLAARSKVVERDIYVSLSVIRVEIIRGRTINTKSRDMDDMRRGLFMDIQKFFRCIGIYNGEINGDQVVTYDAVKKFQKEYGLKIDGILGPKTFAAMERAFEEANSY